jgi:hypothetical protein
VTEERKSDCPMCDSISVHNFISYSNFSSELHFVVEVRDLIAFVDFFVYCSIAKPKADLKPDRAIAKLPIVDSHR